MGPHVDPSNELSNDKRQQNHEQGRFRAPQAVAVVASQE